MATTCRDIVARALRMAGVVPRGENPDADELRDGLLVLQSLYATWLAGGMFGRLKDVFADGDYDAGEGERITVDDATVTIPTTFDDLDGGDRAPREYAPIVVVTTTGETQYLFTAGQWIELGNLEAGDPAPLANLGMNGLAACLALSFAEEFGVQIGAGTLAQARNFKTALSYKFGYEREPVVAAWY